MDSVKINIIDPDDNFISETNYECITSFIKFIIYTRQLTSITYDQLVKDLKASHKSIKIQSSRTALQIFNKNKFKLNIEGVFKGINNIIRTFDEIVKKSCIFGGDSNINYLIGNVPNGLNSDSKSYNDLKKYTNDITLFTGIDGKINNAKPNVIINNTEQNGFKDTSTTNSNHKTANYCLNDAEKSDLKQSINNNLSSLPSYKFMILIGPSLVSAKETYTVNVFNRKSVLNNCNTHVNEQTLKTNKCNEHVCHTTINSTGTQSKLELSDGYSSSTTYTVASFNKHNGANAINRNANCNYNCVGSKSRTSGTTFFSDHLEPSQLNDRLNDQSKCFSHELNIVCELKNDPIKSKTVERFYNDKLNIEQTMDTRKQMPKITKYKPNESDIEATNNISKNVTFNTQCSNNANYVAHGNASNADDIDNRATNTNSVNNLMTTQDHAQEKSANAETLKEIMKVVRHFMVPVLQWDGIYEQPDLVNAAINKIFVFVQMDKEFQVLCKDIKIIPKPNLILPKNCRNFIYNFNFNYEFKCEPRNINKVDTDYLFDLSGIEPISLDDTKDDEIEIQFPEDSPIYNGLRRNLFAFNSNNTSKNNSKFSCNNNSSNIIGINSCNNSSNNNGINSCNNSSNINGINSCNNSRNNKGINGCNNSSNNICNANGLCKINYNSSFIDGRKDSSGDANLTDRCSRNDKNGLIHSGDMSNDNSDKCDIKGERNHRSLDKILDIACTNNIMMDTDSSTIKHLAVNDVLDRNTNSFANKVEYIHACDSVLGGRNNCSNKQNNMEKSNFNILLSNKLINGLVNTCKNNLDIHKGNNFKNSEIDFYMINALNNEMSINSVNSAIAGNKETSLYISKENNLINNDFSDLSDRINNKYNENEDKTSKHSEEKVNKIWYQIGEKLDAFV